MEQVAAEIQESGSAVPVVVCGRNEALAERLRKAGVEHVYGWVDDMPDLMSAADVLVQNAGGLTSLEAFASGLPVASYRCIPGHGQTNAAALQEAGLATWIQDPASSSRYSTNCSTAPSATNSAPGGCSCSAPATARCKPWPPWRTAQFPFGTGRRAPWSDVPADAYASESRS